MDKTAETRKITFWMVSDAILNISTIFLLFIILVMMVLQIIMRYVFNSPLTWSEEVARFSLFWMAFLGSTIAIREKSHLTVDLVVHKFPPRLAKATAIIINLLILAFLVILFFSGLNYVKMNLAITSLVTGVCKGKVYSVIPITAVWMAIYLIRNLVDMLKKGEN